MKDDLIPGDHHITRYCKPLQIIDDETVDGTAYRLRSGEEYLSVNWKEHVESISNNDPIKEIIKALNSKFKMNINGGLALANVGEITSKVLNESDDERVLNVTHQPEDEATHGHDDPSHSGIFNLKEEDDLIADLIALTVTEIYKIKDYP